jgi:hypothetical protein
LLPGKDYFVRRNEHRRAKRRQYSGILSARAWSSPDFRSGLPEMYHLDLFRRPLGELLAQQSRQVLGLDPELPRDLEELLWNFHFNFLPGCISHALVFRDECRRCKINFLDQFLSHKKSQLRHKKNAR